jgi:hypothetical protein
MDQMGCFVCKRPDHKKAECPLLLLEMPERYGKFHAAIRGLLETTTQPTNSMAPSNTLSDPISVDNPIANKKTRKLEVENPKNKIQTLTQKGAIMVKTPSRKRAV